MSVVADLVRAELFLVSQATTCLCLFALSMQQYTISIDVSRLILLEQSSQTNPVDAGVWLMRGLAFAGIGPENLALVLIVDI